MRPLVVQLTTDEPEKASAAFTVAMAAAASGARVDLWLSGPATMFAVTGAEPVLDLPHAPRPQDALDAVTYVRVCSQCAARRGLTDADLRAGAHIAGATTLVEQLLTADAQALTY